jgi:class 3 adenylate cyclase/streptogramin lyase
MQRRTVGHRLGAVLFTDIVGSTAIAAEMGNDRWVELISRHHRIVRRQIHRFDGREIDTAGDGFFVTFERPADAIRCAVAITEAVRELGVEIRAGVSFGELDATGQKPGGIVVNTAARVMSVAGPGEVLVPASVREIVSGGGITFVDHGVHRLKGLEDEFRLFNVTGVDGADVAHPLEADQAAERRSAIIPARARRGALIVGIAAGIFAVSVGAWVLLSGEPTKGPGPLRFSVAKIDVETGSVGSSVFVGDPGDLETVVYRYIDHPLAAGEGGVWLLRAPQLIHIDPLNGEVRSDTIDVGVGYSQSVATGFDAVWVISGDTLSRVHPGTDEVESILTTREVGEELALALGRDVWVGNYGGIVFRIDPSTGARAQADTGLAVSKMAVTSSALWIANTVQDELAQVDLESLEKTGDPIQIAGSMDQIIGLGNGVWILDKRAGTVTRIDTISGTEGRPTRVGDDPTDIAVGLDAVWVSDRDGSLYRLDALTLDVREFPIGAEVLAVDVDDDADAVWVYLGKPVARAAG